MNQDNIAVTEQEEEAFKVMSKCTKQGRIEQLEREKADLIEALECMVISYSEKDSHDYSPLPANEQDSDMKDVMELLERMK